MQSYVENHPLDSYPSGRALEVDKGYSKKTNEPFNPKNVQGLSAVVGFDSQDASI
jgi:hypothetical protein